MLRVDSETCEACAHMRVYSDDDDTAKPEPMSDQHVVDTVALIGDGIQNTLSEA